MKNRWLLVILAGLLIILVFVALVGAVIELDNRMKLTSIRISRINGIRTYTLPPEIKVQTSKCVEDVLSNETLENFVIEAFTFDDWHQLDDFPVQVQNTSKVICFCATYDYNALYESGFSIKHLKSQETSLHNFGNCLNKVALENALIK